MHDPSTPIVGFVLSADGFTDCDEVALHRGAAARLRDDCCQLAATKTDTRASAITAIHLDEQASIGRDR